MRIFKVVVFQTRGSPGRRRPGSASATTPATSSTPSASKKSGTLKKIQIKVIGERRPDDIAMRSHAAGVRGVA